MSDPIVYRSSWPEVIDAYERDLATINEWHERLNEFIRQHSDGRQAMTSRGFGTTRFAGFQARDEDYTNPPEGWRVENRIGTLVPDQRRKAGKAIAEEIKALGQCGKPDLPGMPNDCFTGGRFLSPGMDRYGDTIYVRWSAEPEPGPSLDVWERCPLSAYYAAVELKEAGQ